MATDTINNSFIEKYFKGRQDWIEKPAIFRTSFGKFEPNFYDRKRKTYIHVVDNRQRFHQIRDKVKEARALLGIRIELRNRDGKEIDEIKPTWI
jgi:hypothetical protein